MEGDSKIHDLTGEAEFIRDDLLSNSLEYFLDIYESEEDFDDEEEEEEEEEEEPKPKKAKKKMGDDKKDEKCKNQ